MRQSVLRMHTATSSSRHRVRWPGRTCLNTIVMTVFLSFSLRILSKEHTQWQIKTFVGPINIVWAETKLQHFIVRIRNLQYTYNNNYAQRLDHVGPRCMVIEPVVYSATKHTAHEITTFSDILKTV